MSNYALILAGGTGSRSGQNIPKQFIEGNGKPVICYTIDKFANLEEIDAIIIVCLESWIPNMKEYIKRFNYKNVTVCKNGKTGLDSVYYGVNALSQYDDDDLILIHDAARPFIDSAAITDNIRVAKEHGCALTSVDCVETLIYSEDGVHSERVIPRDCLRRIITPQTFKLGILRKLFSNHEKILNSSYPSTFCLYSEAGYPIYCSKGNERNIKITYSEDVEYFRNFF